MGRRNSRKQASKRWRPIQKIRRKLKEWSRESKRNTQAEAAN
jgi:hypothetical protein